MSLAQQVAGLQWPERHGSLYVDGFGDCRDAVMALLGGWTAEGLQAAAERIASEPPWTGWDNVYCFFCNRDQLNSRKPDDDPRAHESDCSWLGLRAALSPERA